MSVCLSHLRSAGSAVWMINKAKNKPGPIPSIIDQIIEGLDYRIDLPKG